ncbi:glycoside hydrolase family 36 protein [Bifidobacterium aesculapii]|uniref:glycoside hydrolase family 36 protein n=1 Tax=Bifidobacterium aesculapii TaxID=1329411 RepID=UPI0006E3F91C|nr:glycoside hydrolase family 36 protein [Bifidobacterium aesculapii]
MNSTSFTLGTPSWITLVTDDGSHVAPFARRETLPEDVAVDVADNASGGTVVSLSARTTAVRTVKLRWTRPMPKDARYLADEWERSYGTMGFHGMLPNRIMPWYFLVVQGPSTTGYGVKVRPNAMCLWQVDTAGITLVLDVRNGGEGVLLGGRRLDLAEIVAVTYEDVDSFNAAREFCRAMCDDPVLPDAPVYGSNNWYYAYGDSSEREILADADYLAELTEGNANRPFMVVDDCWQEHHRLDDYNGGPWRNGNDRFPDMAALAAGIEARGVRPGIWVRFLLNEDESIPDEWRLPHNGCLDPTHPDAMAYIREDAETLCRWGYQLIKHDFSTFDLFGRWGFQMNPFVTADGWHLHDRSVTSAEAVKALYRTIFDVTQAHGAMVLGCNTIGHLGAGLMQLDRTGDDTSGVDWERTRFNGVNTLAFRLPQHGTFFDTDADCVGIGDAIDWAKNRQWAEAIARSGTSLFFSAKPHTMAPQDEQDLREILAMSAAPQEHAIPLDWELTDCPEEWESELGMVRYDWYQPQGLAFGPRTNRGVSILTNIDE